MKNWRFVGNLLHSPWLINTLSAGGVAQIIWETLNESSYVRFKKRVSLWYNHVLFIVHLTFKNGVSSLTNFSFDLFFLSLMYSSNTKISGSWLDFNSRSVINWVNICELVKLDKKSYWTKSQLEMHRAISGTRINNLLWYPYRNASKISPSKSTMIWLSN